MATISELFEIYVPPQEPAGSSTQLINNDRFVGVEVEAEGVSIIPPPAVRGWRASRHEGSLRNNGIEYVLAGPKRGKPLSMALAALNRELDKVDGIDYTIRTSVHVHLDFREYQPDDVARFVVAYAIVERLLMNYVGVARANNNFCLPTYDCKDFNRWVLRLLSDGSLPVNDTHRYLGLNLVALKTFGSVEIRWHGGTHDKNAIRRWINILFKVLAFSETLTSAAKLSDLVDNVSAQPAHLVAEDMLGEYYGIVTAGLTDEEVDRLVLKGIRHAQFIIYYLIKKEAI